MENNGESSDPMDLDVVDNLQVDDDEMPPISDDEIPELRVAEEMPLPTADDHEIDCPVCTFKNARANRSCSMCGKIFTPK